MPADAAYNDEFLQILHRVILEVKKKQEDTNSNENNRIPPSSCFYDDSNPDINDLCSLPYRPTSDPERWSAQIANTST